MKLGTPPSPLRLIAASLLATALAGCVAPIGPVAVTRFHLADTMPLGHGAIAVVAAPGNDPAALEWQSYRGAVARQLLLLGYSAGDPATAPQLAELGLVRSTLAPPRGSSPVSVGVGGSAGSYGSGLGIGIGLNLSPKAEQQIASELAVRIRERASSRVLWEGRAEFTVRASSPLAASGLGAAKLGEALFKGFPGVSGETVAVP